MADINIPDLAITVVEPSAVQAQIIAGHLRDAGAQNVQTFHNGAAVLAYLERYKSDLVISAMYLPDMTGAELVQRMRATRRLEDLPFMLISSETSFAMLDPIRQAGVVAILPKPFAPQDLRRALAATLEFVNPDAAALADIVLDDLQVLVVDDSSTARKHISRVLKNLGIDNITTAENGRAAVELIEHNFFDLVVTDYNMPEMDGEMLTRHIREHSSQRSIPVLMVTSEGDSSRLSAVQQAGVSGICDKPFDAITVKQMIRNMLAG
ncbi:MAG: response regulator [Gammaproteobacteria bacterium]|nr:response regulator [Gammaproteobacteria bacterium]